MKIWLDCDPGHDDAVAMLIAARWADLVGVSSVAGNSPVGNTTTNALIVAQVAGITVPVFAGCDRPMVRPAAFAPNIHGESGLAGPAFPPLTRSVEPGHGVHALIAASHEHDNLWLVATGPLTNVALAMRLDPTLVDRLAGISIMGGGVNFGNTTAWAEFNIWADPEAADVVFRSGIDRLVMCPLDITHQVLISLDDAAMVRGWGGPAAEFFGDMLAAFAENYRDVFFTEALGPLHDPCAVMALTHPELFTVTRRHVVIELAGRHTRGMTVVDQRDVKQGDAPQVDLLSAVDVDGVRAVLFDTIRAVC
jgi:inosine-uridine nucleoside N-ribohydrolase